MEGGSNEPVGAGKVIIAPYVDDNGCGFGAEPGIKVMRRN
jgi:hypothetical protein